MTLQYWLREQVQRLEREIRESTIFDNSRPASQEELLRLRRKVAIHTFLAQELERRDARSERQSRARARRAALRSERITQEVKLPACVNC